jgi:hypothetical protein
MELLKKWLKVSLKTFCGNRRNTFGMSLLVALLGVASPGGAAETVKIYRSTMPDGSVVLSDKPSQGARSVATHNYVLTAPRGNVEAEREYWRRQSDAFNLRHQQREGQARARRMSPGAAVDPLGGEDGWFPLSAYTGHRSHDPLVPMHAVPGRYASSPGAIRGRSSGFIGSGFSTSR